VSFGPCGATATVPSQPDPATGTGTGPGPVPVHDSEAAGTPVSNLGRSHSASDLEGSDDAAD
jgi:hypothetical protein